MMGFREESVKGRLEQARAELDESLRADDFDLVERPVHNARLAFTVSALAQAVGTMLGECRRDLPYAPLQPIINVDGSFAWCCTHKTPHCAP